MKKHVVTTIVAIGLLAVIAVTKSNKPFSTFSIFLIGIAYFGIGYCLANSDK